MPVFANQLGTLNYSSPEAIKAIANHIRIMQEELEYRLSCLDSSNINEIKMDETNIISKDGSLISILNSYGESIAAITVGPDSITAQVSEMSGKMAALELTVDGINTMLYDPESGFSVLSQTVNDISGTVVDLQKGLATSLKLDATGVYITDQNGKQVVISGGQIAANSIYATSLHLGGNLTVYNSVTGKTIGGYLGYASSLQNGKAGMQMASSNRYYVDPIDGSTPLTGMYGEIGVTNDGSRMAYHYKYTSGVYGNAIVSTYGSIDDKTLGTNIRLERVDTAGGGQKYQYFYFLESSFYAQSNNVRATLGTASQLWGQIYSTNSTISTSDRNSKNSIEYDIDPRYDTLWSLLRPCTGKYNDGTSDRTHMFLISQDVEEAIEQAGLTSKDFAAFIKSPKEDEDGYVYALRYEEFIPLCIRHIQMLEARVAELERS